MDENDSYSLDNEYKRYLQIMKMYLGQILDQRIIEVCNAWIKRLSECKDDEKNLRNKYIFALCYQLAKGEFEEPFLKPPPSGGLRPLEEEINSDESSTEVECLVIDTHSPVTKVIYNNPKTLLTTTDDQGTESESQSTTTHNVAIYQNESLHGEDTHQNEFTSYEQSLFCYTCPEVYIDKECDKNDDKYKSRAANLILKLRQIKEQNILLHNELRTLKKASKSQFDDERLHKVDNSTSTNLSIQSSYTNINLLKNKIQELQDARSTLIDTVAELQEKLDYYNDHKHQEIEDIKAKNKLEIINIKATIREEISSNHEAKLEELKRQYEQCIADLHKNHEEEIHTLTQEKDNIIAEKDKIIGNKETEISQLKDQIDEMKRNQLSVINRLLDKPDVSESSSKTEELEKRLSRMEKARFKSTKAYEAKLAQLQRQKHLAECSLQLQLIKQRNQVINEVTDENQTELSTALEKLEYKYKEIVANVQATAVQRRMQDQLALDSIIQAISGVRNTFANTQAANQLAGKTMRSSNKNSNHNDDIELSSLFQGNKVGSVIVGKPFGEHTIANEYCLDSGKLGELFDRVNIPQRDTGDTPTKK